MKLKTLAAIAALWSALPAASADPAPAATAFIDWSNFKVTLVPASGSLDWWGQSSGVNADSGSYVTQSASDWTSPISVADGVASAIADGSTLKSEFSSSPASLNSSAWTYRNGSFTLAAQTIAVFSVPASTYIDMSVPINGSAYAWAFLNVDGPGVFGTDQQHSGTESLSWASGLGSPQSNARTLQASFLNLTDSPMDGTISAYAAVNKNGFIPVVPEPGTYAMMLAGLGLCGFIALRRKQEHTET